MIDKPNAQASDAHPIDDDELLVAYLDGELQGAEQAALQSRLSDDAQLRRRLAEFQRTWDLLDEIPEPEPKADFTKTTLELTAIDAAKQATGPLGDVSPRVLLSPRVWIATVASTVALGFAFWLGGLLGHSQLQQARQSELEQLPLWADLDGLQAELELRLSRQVLEIPGWELLAERPLGTVPLPPVPLPPVPSELERRGEWIEQLDADQQAVLHRNRRQYRQLDETQRRAVAELEQQWQADASGQLKRAGHLLAALLERALPDTERAKLLAEPPKVQWAVVREALYWELGQLQAERLSESDGYVLLDWAEPWLEAHLAQIFTLRGAALLTQVYQTLYGRPTSRPFSGTMLGWIRETQGGEAYYWLQRADTTNLRAELSAALSGTLEGLAEAGELLPAWRREMILPGQGSNRAAQLLVRWLESAAVSDLGVTASPDLYEIYRSLPNQRRNQADLLLSPEQIERELRSRLPRRTRTGRTSE